MYAPISAPRVLTHARRGKTDVGPQGMGEYRSERKGRAVDGRPALRHHTHGAGRSPNGHSNETVSDRVVPASRVHAHAWRGILETRCRGMYECKGEAEGCREQHEWANGWLSICNVNMTCIGRAGVLMDFPIMHRRIEWCAGQACALAAGKLRQHAKGFVKPGENADLLATTRWTKE